jgi:cytochrome c
LPAGVGSVAKGQDVWEGKCAQCHGIFGESGEVFSPLVGGVTPQDIKTGRVANLITPGYPGRTTFMKVATLSTLWDYINRAMPWTSPKSLTTEEVFSVLAFLLNLNGIVPDDFTLSDQNIRAVQQRMPNRNGMTTKHSLWAGEEFAGSKKADTHNVACMKDCAPEPKLASFLPDFARNSHGNLATQNRAVGAQHGADTTRPEAKLGAAPAVSTAAPKAEGSGAGPTAALALLQKNGCTVCHGLDKKIVGPAFTDVARKHAGKEDYLAGKIKSGGSGIWGPIPMPAQTLSDAETKTISAWLATGADR